MVKAVQQRSAQLMHTSERQLHLRLDPSRSRNPKTHCSLDQELQQGRFPDTRFAAQHQHTAVTVASIH